LRVGLALGLCAPAASFAQPAPPSLDVSIEGLTPAGDLPLSSAFCLPPSFGAKPQDKSPEIRWSAGPAGTQSYALLMVDPDVTADLSLMNKPGVTIPADAPRMDIYHWLLVDIAPDIHEIPAGAEGDGFVPGGKPIGTAHYGVRGTNDYYPFFNSSASPSSSMKGPYGGFDGPCPPSNDLLVHRYVFEVFALDEKTLGLSGRFFAADVLRAMQGHILARGQATAKFSFGAPPRGGTAVPAGLGLSATTSSTAGRQP
jgi:Raf kinase inhibitor-like YbhB/YbcL family protein